MQALGGTVAHVRSDTTRDETPQYTPDEVWALVVQLINATAPQGWRPDEDWFLARVEVVAQLRAALDEHLTQVGRDAARVGGHSYAAIGAAAGMSRQAAHKRFRRAEATR